MNIVKDMQAATASSKRTNQFLHMVSKRLANRSECKGQTYVLKIYTERWYQTISFEPNVQVFPNSSRYESCKQPIMQYILEANFDKFVINFEDKIRIMPNTFVDGDYIYTQWIYQRRRWHDLKSNKELSDD